MQAKKSSIERRSSALPASPKGAAPAETQLNLILNEIQSEQDFRPQLLSFRHTVARALRGYKLTDLLAIHEVTLIGGGLDEAPHAYKDIHSVMAAQKDLVEVVGMFTPKIVKMDSN